MALGSSGTDSECIIERHSIMRRILFCAHEPTEMKPCVQQGSMVLCRTAKLERVYCSDKVHEKGAVFIFQVDRVGKSNSLRRVDDSVS
jgi:hypothetical protein